MKIIFLSLSDIKFLFVECAFDLGLLKSKTKKKKIHRKSEEKQKHVKKLVLHNLKVVKFSVDQKLNCDNLLNYHIDTF